MLKTAIFALQFFPLAVFLGLAFKNGAPLSVDWLLTFVGGGGAALLQLALYQFLARQQPIDRIILGVDIYLIVGAGAALTNQMALLDVLNKLKESGIFVALLMVGTYTTFASKFGFVGSINSLDQRRIKLYSLYLLGLTCVAAGASFWLRGNMLV